MFFPRFVKLKVIKKEGSVHEVKVYKKRHTFYGTLIT